MIIRRRRTDLAMVSAARQPGADRSVAPHARGRRAGTALLCAALWTLAPSAPASEAHEVHHHSNHLALFLGGTDGKGEIGVAFTVGLDYERRLGKGLGIVALFDYAARPLEETVLGAGLMVHPTGGLVFTVAPGVLFEKERGGHDAASRSAGGYGESSGTNAELVLRVGVMYEIEIGERFSLAPQFDLDLLGRDTVPVFGVSAGIGF